MMNFTSYKYKIVMNSYNVSLNSLSISFTKIGVSPHTYYGKMPFYSHLLMPLVKKYFDMFPLESVQLPKIIENDLDDLGERAKEIAYRAGNYHKHVLEAGQWQNAVQGYLASIAFADALLGKLLDALEQSAHANNTIVVLWSDHGWQLGEKEHWRKFAMWDNVARTVMMMKVPKGVPGLAQGAMVAGRCDRVTSLLDIFPTLIDLCGLHPSRTLTAAALYRC